MREEDQVLEILKTILFKYGYWDHSVCFSKNDWLHQYPDNPKYSEKFMRIGETRRTDYFIFVNIRQDQEVKDVVFGSSEKDYWKATEEVIEKIQALKKPRVVELHAA